MADRSRYPDAGDNTGLVPNRERPPRMPRWVRLSAVIVGVLIVLAVVVMLASGGQHGPARHTSTSGMSISTVTSVDGGLSSLANAHR